jgi:hypothetical protein
VSIFFFKPHLWQEKEKMFTDQFAHQSLKLRAEYVKKNGTFLIGRLGKIYVYNLYEIHGFFGEIAWDTRNGKLKGVDTFQEISKLESYLKRIQLNELRNDAL